MRAVRYYGQKDIRVEDIDAPEAGKGEVLIDIAWCGICGTDLHEYLEGPIFCPKPGHPHPITGEEPPVTLGHEFSGVVAALGEGVDAALLGARVATATATGAYAEHFTAPADRLLAVPEGIDLAEAAALPLQGMTAHYLCRSTFPVEEGHTVVVTAGAGGVGLLLTQLATARGARVVTTASTEEKRELSRGAGAVAAVDYPDLAATVAELTDGEGAHAVFDGVGKDTFDTSLEVLRVRGTLVLFGGASGQVPPFDLQRLNAAGSLYVTRPSLVHYTRTGEETRWRGGEVFGAWASGELDVRIGERFPLADAAAAHAALESRSTTGKVLLTLS